MIACAAGSSGVVRSDRRLGLQHRHHRAGYALAIINGYAAKWRNGGTAAPPIEVQAASF
jgi:hypothetical protein